MDSYDASKNGMNQITYVVTLYELEGTTYMNVIWRESKFIDAGR